MSLAYRQEPDEGLLAELEKPALRAALKAADRGLTRGSAASTFREKAACVETADFSGDAESLAEEYARMFIVPGPEKISPFESMHSGPDADLMGPEATDVRRFVEKFGLSLEKTNLMPDHVAVEFAVLGKLADAESEAWAADDVKNVVEFREAERLFLEKHLSRWFPKFADDVISAAKLPFYKSVSEFAKAFLEEEAKGLKIVL